ncbi:MAG TPA: dCTP deaminase, partial [Gemmatimonadota bacterium]|nr:dCTP deaminase [Gemmatimonadota bacterium]
KSTYARCLSADTRVALVDGSTPTLEEMATRHDAGETFFGYAVGPHGRIVVALLDAPRYVGRDPLVEVTLDDGGQIRSTPDHRFLLRNGDRSAAEDLAPGTSLMPLYRDVHHGRETVYQPSTAHPVSATARNHKVVSVRSLPGEHDVFCLTVPEAGNFALASGVFVENCGIIVNVTPFEPEWEGHVTLEISNTTPLPAKIYAREGLAQVLFFESDEPCEVSYRERGGKYQSQRGVTLPRL